jgi:hypothetical protein
MINHLIIKILKNPTIMFNYIILKLKSHLLGNYYFSSVRYPKVKSKVPHDDPCAHNAIKNDLLNNDIRVADYEIDLADYNYFMLKASYKKYPLYYVMGQNTHLFEKSLEHYLASKLLQLNADDTYLDIASANSPAPDIYHELFGCQVFRQDLDYCKGLKGDKIGGNACRMPIEDGFCTKMALHCSFEHFEGDNDILFIKEANRVLRKGGKLCILPLYLFTKYANQIDPILVETKKDVIEKDMTLYCLKGYTNYHRFYDVNHFIERVYRNLDKLKITLYMVKNGKEISPHCHIKFIALFEKE